MVKKTEQKALIIAVICGLIMGLSGLYIYNITKLGSIFLDASFSLITAISYLSAIWISKNSSKKSKLYPEGKYLFEPLYGILQSILTLFLMIFCSYESFTNLLEYFINKKGNMLIIGPLIPYSIIMLIISFFLAFIFNKYNKKIKNNSIILKVGKKSAIIDGLISSAIGVSLLIVSFIKEGSRFYFMIYTGDSIISLLLILILINDPLQLIYESFIELTQGVVKNNEVEMQVKNVLNNYIKIKEVNTVKIGTFYKIKIIVDDDNFKFFPVNMNLYKKEIKKKLKKVSTNIKIEFIF